jgi:uncharacterized protein (DUF885 family)
MSDQDALDLMQKRCFQTPAEAEGELQREKLSSVQLPTYFTGVCEWWKFRERSERSAGRNFDMMKFTTRPSASDRCRCRSSSS